MNEPPELRRSLFGYSKQDVESILQTRERMFEQATEEATERRSEAERLRSELESLRAETAAARDETQSLRNGLSGQAAELRRELETARGERARLDEQRREAEARAARLDTEVARGRSEISALTTRLRSAEATEAELRGRLTQSPAAGPDTRELDAVLGAAQEAIERIMTGARKTAEQDLARVQRTRDEIQAEIDRVRSWRERLDPVAREIAGEIAVAQKHMSEAADRVGAALQPMSEALMGLSHRLDELARAADATIASGDRPNHVDLVSHERTDTPVRQAEPDESAQHEAAAGTPAPAEPLPHSWR